MSKWKVKKENGSRSHIIDEDDMYVAEMIYTPLAEQIVREHNAFNELIDACVNAIDVIEILSDENDEIGIDPNFFLQKIKNAISKAKGNA